MITKFDAYLLKKPTIPGNEMGKWGKHLFHLLGLMLLPLLTQIRNGHSVMFALCALAQFVSVSVCGNRLQEAV